MASPLSRTWRDNWGELGGNVVHVFEPSRGSGVQSGAGCRGIVGRSPPRSAVGPGTAKPCVGPVCLGQAAGRISQNLVGVRPALAAEDFPSFRRRTCGHDLASRCAGFRRWAGGGAVGEGINIAAPAGCVGGGPRRRPDPPQSCDWSVSGSASGAGAPSLLDRRRGESAGSRVRGSGRCCDPPRLHGPSLV